MLVLKKFVMGITAFIFITITVYPFCISNNVEYIDDAVYEKVRLILFGMWSFSGLTFTFLYKSRSADNIRMAVFAVILFCFMGWRFSEKVNLFNNENSEDLVLYQSKQSKNRKIVERLYYTGITGSNAFYDTVEIYKLTSWARYITPFKLYKFDTAKWQKMYY